MLDLIYLLVSPSLVTHIMDAWTAIVLTHLDKKCTEANLMGQYTKLVVALDDMVQMGHWAAIEELPIDTSTRFRAFPSK